MTSLGQKIRNARDALGLTQEELAARVGRTRVTVSEWESDKKRPRRALVPRLSEVLQLPPSVFSPHGLGGVSIAPTPQTATLTFISWTDVPLIARGQAPMSSEQVIVYNNPTAITYPDEKRIRVDDDSMSPVYNKGDIIRFSQELQPYDGCQVVAWVDGESEGVLRNYRARGNNSFDLWPNNPENETLTLNQNTKLVIVGVVVRHLRLLQPPSE